MDIVIYDPQRSRKYVLGSDVLEGVWFEKGVPGGHLLAGWTDRRDIRFSYPDLQQFNIVELWNGGDTPRWIGWMKRPKRIVKQEAFEITCCGFSSRLEQWGSWSNIASMKAFTYITGTMLADERLGLAAGDIHDDGYTADAIEVRPYRKYAEIMSTYMSQLAYWYWTVDERGINWRQYNAGDADYIVALEECSGGDVAEAGNEYSNAIVYSWTVDGSRVKVAAVYNEDEIDRAGMTIAEYISVPGKASDTSALAQANVRLTENALKKIAAGLTTSRVLDARTYKPVELDTIKEGQNIMVSDLLSITEAIQSSRQAQSLATFMIKNIRYDNAVPQVDITPGDFQSRLDIQLARTETK